MADKTWVGVMDMGGDDLGNPLAFYPEGLPVAGDTLLVSSTVYPLPISGSVAAGVLVTIDGAYNPIIAIGGGYPDYVQVIGQAYFTGTAGDYCFFDAGCVLGGTLGAYATMYGMMLTGNIGPYCMFSGGFDSGGYGSSIGHHAKFPMGNVYSWLTYQLFSGQGGASLDSVGLTLQFASGGVAHELVTDAASPLAAPATILATKAGGAANLNAGVQGTLALNKVLSTGGGSIDPGDVANPGPHGTGAAAGGTLDTSNRGQIGGGRIG